jgi:glutathione synthase/RimK-type ligase-like ATP-grasp enzyme
MSDGNRTAWDAATVKVNAANLKVLVIAIEDSALGARISMALANVGCCVASLAPRKHSVRRLRKISDHFAYRARPRLRSTFRAIELWSPDILICTDELAVEELQILHQRTVRSRCEAHRRISTLIENSIGPATSFRAMLNKSDFLACAKIEGVRCPRTMVFPATRPFVPALTELTYPIVVKADQSYGGRCVRIVNNESDLKAAVWELQIPSAWRSRPLIGAIFGSKALNSLLLPLRRTISIQQFISGRPGNRAVVCWKGKVLAGISVEAVEVTRPCGPSSVVRTIDHPEIAIAAERMVGHLGLSGFVGFDFIIDPSGRAWLLEMNPRVTPICHLSFDDDTNLAESLFEQMTGLSPRTPSPTMKRGLIVLFPNEVARCPASQYLKFDQHDVPWSEPELVRITLNRTLRTGFRMWVRAFLERHLPAAVRTLVKLRLIVPRSGDPAAKEREHPMAGHS